MTSLPKQINFIVHVHLIRKIELTRSRYLLHKIRASLISFFSKINKSVRLKLFSSLADFSSLTLRKVGALSWACFAGIHAMCLHFIRSFLTRSYDTAGRSWLSTTSGPLTDDCSTQVRNKIPQVCVCRPPEVESRGVVPCTASPSYSTPTPFVTGEGGRLWMESL